jgi:hypothetical protein
MACNEIRPALSELVDGLLLGDARARIESHLDGCPACRQVLADLRAVKQAARALPKMTPPETVWMNVRTAVDAEMPAARRLSPKARTEVLAHKETSEPKTEVLGHSLSSEAEAHSPKPRTEVLGHTEPAPRRILRFMPAIRPAWQMLAAAAVLVIAVSAGLYYSVGRPAPITPAPAATTATAPATTPQPAAHAGSAATVQSVEAELDAADQHYTKAIAALEQVTKEGQSSLDPQTVAVLEKANTMLDQAIRDSRAALKAQPASEVAQVSLFDALQRKVALLRDTISLINEMRKGDQAGVARAVGNLGKG